MTKRRPRPPKRRPGMRWIQPVWRQRTQRWEWRPARKIEGKVVFGRSYATQEEAFAAAEQIESKRATLVRIGDLTLEQACERYLVRLEGDGGSPHTATGYRSRFGRWYDILARTAPISAITADDVEHFKLQRRAKHGVGSDTIRKDLVVLQHVLDVAGLTGESNPVRGVRRPKGSAPDRPFLAMEQVAGILARIRAAAKPWSEWHATVIAFLALTGARAYEIDRLRARHVEELDDGACSVILHGAKGHRTRRVVVAAGSAPIVWRFVRDALDGPPLNPTTIATICKRWKRALGLPHLCGRVLRRTYATEMARHESMQYVQAFLGHSQLTTTQKYLGVDPTRARAAAARLHSALAGTDRADDPPRDQPTDES